LRLEPAQRRFLVGATLALAFFLIEAGIVEIALGKDEACRAQVARMRLPTDPFSVCLPEWKWHLLLAASRGAAWAFSSDASPFYGWLAMGVFYAVVGGVSAQVFRKWGFVAFLCVHAAAVALFAGLGFLRGFIA